MPVAKIKLALAALVSAISGKSVDGVEIEVKLGTLDSVSLSSRIGAVVDLDSFENDPSATGSPLEHSDKLVSVNVAIIVASELPYATFLAAASVIEDAVNQDLSLAGTVRHVELVEGGMASMQIDERAMLPLFILRFVMRVRHFWDDSTD